MSKALHILKWNVVATAMATCFYIPFTRPASAGEWFWHIVGAFVYSNFIGTLIGVLFVGDSVSRFVGAFRAPFNYVVLGSILIAATAVGCIAASATLVGVGMLPPKALWAAIQSSLIVGTGISLGLGIGGFVYDSLRHRLDRATLALRTKELEEERARKLAVEARLSSLESRVHPHFLFNTLNSIAALIREDPAEAERTVERLAALLRFSLDSPHTTTVGLDQELAIVKQYLDIERVRFGERLHYEIDVPMSLGAVDVPPLSVQTLVENSIKHAVSPNRAGAHIRISARLVDDVVVVEVADDGPGFTDACVIEGHGLDLLRQRLSVVFGAEASLDITTRDGKTAVAMSTPRVARAVERVV